MSVAHLRLHSLFTADFQAANLRNSGLVHALLCPDTPEILLAHLEAGVGEGILHPGPAAPAAFRRATRWCQIQPQQDAPPAQLFPARMSRKISLHGMAKWHIFLVARIGESFGLSRYTDPGNRAERGLNHV